MTDLTHFSVQTIFVWIVGFLIMEFPMRYIYLNIENNEQLKIWYDFEHFNIYNVIIADLFYMLVGLIIAFRIYYALFGKDINIFKFFAVFWIVQMVGDVCFYLVVSNLPEDKQNKWTRFFTNYGRVAGINAVLGDSIYILVWTLTTFMIKSLPIDMLSCIMFFAIFAISGIAEK